MSSMRFDPSGLVVACRRVVERHPECGPLWWLCAHLLTAQEPFQLAWELADEIDDDSTADALAAAIPDDAVVLTIGWTDIASRALTRRGDVTVLVVDSRHHGSSMMQRLERHDVACELVQAEAIGRAVPAADLVLVEAHAVSSDRVVAPIGSAAAAAVAATCGVPVWLVAGVGRRLPARAGRRDRRTRRQGRRSMGARHRRVLDGLRHPRRRSQRDHDRDPRGTRFRVPDGARAVAREPDLTHRQCRRRRTAYRARHAQPARADRHVHR